MLLNTKISSLMKYSRINSVCFDGLEHNVTKLTLK